ncbi:hypothetical protein ES703_51616 [subsurface metagenome]
MEEEEEEEEEPVGEQEEEEEPAVGEPQYGGTISYCFSHSVADPPAPDIQLGPARFNWWIGHVQEQPICGNFEKYGPRGTGEYAFQTAAYIPSKYQEGLLIESWEVTPEKIVWQVRPGIYWSPNEYQRVHVMERRELVAEDMVDWLLYFREAPGGTTFKAQTTKIYAEGRYTVVIETPKFNRRLMYLVTYEDRAHYQPPETRAAGVGEWKNQVGTGPFMFEEYVRGSYLSYERNPNYWKTTTINGVEYQLPFADRIVMPIIPDISVQIAALRTAALDYHQIVPFRDWDSLERTNPELLYCRACTGTVWVLVFNCQEEGSPVQDREVRRALMIGTDRAAIDELVSVEKPVHWWPGGPAIAGSYTPLEELPEETRLLYDYNPTLAKQMLADAGYPNGFEIGMVLSPWIGLQERGALIQAQWAKLGVELKLKTQEEVEYAAKRYTLKYGDSRIDNMQCVSPSDLFRWGHSTGALNFAGLSNERFDYLTETGSGIMDDAEANVYFKEAAVLGLNEVAVIPLDMWVESAYWWPWIKNYYGEMNVGDAGQIAALFAHMWIDQDLKAEMGY